MVGVRDISVGARPIGRLPHRDPEWRSCPRCGVKMRRVRQARGQHVLCQDCRAVLDIPMQARREPPTHVRRRPPSIRLSYTNPPLEGSAMPVDLAKRTETATESLISLMKDADAKGIDLGDVTAQVDLAVDYSWSMTHRYPTEVDDLVQRCLALSMTGLDDDKTVPVHFFHEGVFEPVYADEVNYPAVVSTFTANHSMGGTKYVPVLKQILGERRFGSRKPKDDTSAPPHLVLFVTDGAPSDMDAAKKLIVASSGRPYFFAFLGLGLSLDFLRDLDTMSGRVIDNVSLTEVDSTLDMDDPTFYRTILDEWLTSWLPQARQKGLCP